ncbi:prenyltransferase [Nocardioides campestrisoli]|uniref:prenyltransferase n=1 Tax=Nocardioides campestrisoli TaxID=2736757 RepID=UPI0015E7994A|nr:prenyltransferase [Nocardioides campestrisoli]
MSPDLSPGVGTGAESGRSPGVVGRAGQLLASSRPLSWVNTAFPFGAAYLLAGGSLDAAFWVGVAYFLVPYNLLMYGVNDVFDYESDLRNPRKGGVEGVVLDRGLHRATLWAAGLSNVPFLVALLLWGSPTSALVLGVSVFAVVAYSAPRLRFKERPFLDSLTSSTHFVSPAAFGLALAAARGAEVSLDRTALAALAGFFAWGVASHAFGAVQDVTADRAGGIGSIGTVMGARTTTWFALGAYLLGGALLLFLPWPGTLAAALVLPYVANVAPYLSITDEDCERANAGWRRFLWLNFLTGFLVTQLMIWIALR